MQVHIQNIFYMYGEMHFSTKKKAQLKVLKGGSSRYICNKSGQGKCAGLNQLFSTINNSFIDPQNKNKKFIFSDFLLNVI